MNLKPMRENMIRDTTSYRKNIEDTHFEPVDSMDCEIDTVCKLN